MGCTPAFAVFLEIFSKTASFPLALLLTHVCANTNQTVNNAAIQLVVDDNKRGRITIVLMLSFGLTPIGVFPMVVAPDTIGDANVILGATGLLIVLTGFFYFPGAILRNLDTTANETMVAREVHQAA